MNPKTPRLETFLLELETAARFYGTFWRTKEDNIKQVGDKPLQVQVLPYINSKEFCDIVYDVNKGCSECGWHHVYQ